MALTITQILDVLYPDDLSVDSTSVDSVLSSLPCSQVCDPDDNDDTGDSVRLHLDTTAFIDDRHSIHRMGLLPDT